MSEQPADDPFEDCDLGPDAIFGTRTFEDALFTTETETPVNVLTGETPEHSQATVDEAVAAWEHDTTVRQLTSDERQRVYIALYQSHLPKLDKHNLIRYSQPRGNIHVRPLLAGFAPYLADGLHAEGDQLSVADTEEQPESSRVIEAVGSLFTQ